MTACSIIPCFNEGIYSTNFKKHPHVFPSLLASSIHISYIIMLLSYYSPKSKIQAIEAKLQKMQDRNPSMDLKPVPGSSQLSVVQREARLKQLELINAKKQSRKPYKRWSVTTLLPCIHRRIPIWLNESLQPMVYHLLPKWTHCHAVNLIRVYAISIMDVLLDFVSIVTDLKQILFCYNKLQTVWKIKNNKSWFWKFILNSLKFFNSHWLHIHVPVLKK